MSERDYLTGYQAACRSMLQHISRHLGKNAKASELKLELAEARAELRKLCGELNCNTWSDSLHLADVISKHLAPRVRYLELADMSDEQRIAMEVGR